MAKVDFNCYVGNWPFHRIRNNTFEDLKKLHKKVGIDYGYVSAFEAIFYHDPYEADALLAKEIAGSNYKHVVTVNPKLPGCLDSIRRMVSEFPVAGVRILPSFHKYRLGEDQDVENLCALLKELNLPLFLNLRMVDERTEYMFLTEGFSVWDVDTFIGRHSDLKIVICNARNGELGWLKNMLKYSPNVCVDTSGFKNELFGFDTMYNEGTLESVVYGSGAPLLCMMSTTLYLDYAAVPQEVKDAVYAGKAFYNPER